MKNLIISSFSNGEKIKSCFQANYVGLRQGAKTGVMQRIMRIFATQYKGEIIALNKEIILSTLLLSFFIVQLAQAQCVSGDCANGRGIYMYPSGAKYIGDFKDGEIHGIGTCYYSDGSKYQGEWNFRYPQGKGIKTLADGTRLEGQWLKGQRMDARGMAIPDPVEDDGTDIQVGCILGDCENGEGTFAYANGGKYEGQFRNGKMDGQGVWHYANGDKYEGSFVDNYPNGTGSLYAGENSDATTGYWIKGEYMGDHRVKGGQVGCISGNCDDGTGTYVYKDATAKYVGTFADGVAHGKGVCEFSNGDRYEGQWKAGKFAGWGTLIFKDGRRAEGMWTAGTYIGKNRKKPAPAEDPAPVASTPPNNIPTTAAKNIKVWAIVIGVGSYNHMPPLRYTDDDAYRMYAFLKSPEGGALPDEQIRILIDEDATKAKILAQMNELYSQAGSDDLILLYFSGHGLKGSFLPIDFDGFNNKLQHDEINEMFKASKAKYKLCIADACHSGSLLAMRSGTVSSTLSNYYKTLAQAEPGTALIMSSKSEENSLESSGLRQGVFSHFLIRGLKGEADQNTDKVISVNELFNYVHDNVVSYTGNLQSPVIKGDYDGKMTVGVLRK